MDTTSAAHYHAEQQNAPNGLVVAGWVCCFLLTPVGFIIAIILTAKGRWKHGVAMMLACGIYWLIIFMVALNGFTNEVDQSITEFNTAVDAYNACIQKATTLAEMNQC
jgi:hypothetical protein